MPSVYELASAISNDIDAGLKGTGNEPYSLAQLEQEVIWMREKIIRDFKLSNLEITNLVQSINCVEVDCNPVSLCCNIETFDNKLHFTIPRVSSTVIDPIRFVGLVDRSESFRIVRGSTWRVNDYNKWNKNKPYVWFVPPTSSSIDIDGNIASGVTHGFIFNPPTEDIKYISVDAIFEDPTALEQFACCPTDIKAHPSIIPSWMAPQIKEYLVNEWTKNYYKKTYKPNTQTSM